MRAAVRSPLRGEPKISNTGWLKSTKPRRPPRVPARSTVAPSCPGSRSGSSAGHVLRSPSSDEQAGAGVDARTSARAPAAPGRRPRVVQDDRPPRPAMSRRRHAIDARSTRGRSPGVPPTPSARDRYRLASGAGFALSIDQHGHAPARRDHGMKHVVGRQRVRREARRDARGRVRRRRTART